MNKMKKYMYYAALVSLLAIPASASAGSLIIGIPGDSYNSSVTGSDYVDGGYDGRVSKYKPDYIEGTVKSIFKRLAPKKWNIICEPLDECDRMIKIKSKDKRNWVNVFKDSTSSLIKKNKITITLNERTHVVFVKGDASPNAVRTWKVSKKGTLKSTLNSWASQVGYELRYSVKSDWTTGLNITVEGTFETVVKKLVDSFKRKGASIDVNVNNKLKLIYISKGTSLYEIK